MIAFRFQVAASETRKSTNEIGIQHMSLQDDDEDVYNSIGWSTGPSGSTAARVGVSAGISSTCRSTHSVGIQHVGVSSPVPTMLDWAASFQSADAVDDAGHATHTAGKVSLNATPTTVAAAPPGFETPRQPSCKAAHRLWLGTPTKLHWNL